jgi:hypothetical protein
MVIATAATLVFVGTTGVYAHGVQGGFGGTQPNFVLAIVMTSVAAFGFIVFAVKRIGFRLSAGLLLGSAYVLTFTVIDLTRFYYSGFSYSLMIGYEATMDLLLISFLGTIGGGIFTAYHFWGVKPYLSRKITK